MCVKKHFMFTSNSKMNCADLSICLALSQSVLVKILNVWFKVLPGGDDCRNVNKMVRWLYTQVLVI